MVNQPRFLVVYAIRTRRLIYNKILLKSLKINSKSLDLQRHTTIFTCNVDPSLSWYRTVTNIDNWIPVDPLAVSGFLCTDPDSLSNSSWSIDLGLKSDTGSHQSTTSFSVQCSYERDQGFMCLPISVSDSNLSDELYLSYLFVHGYSPPSIKHGIPRRIDFASFYSNSNTEPLVIGHAGAGAKRSNHINDLQWPENTICAFKRAEQLGVSMVECDASVTRDCEAVVLHHNFTLGVRSLQKESNETTYVINHCPDDPINETTTDLIVNYSLSEIRKLLRKVEGPTHMSSEQSLVAREDSQFVHPRALTEEDPLPDVSGVEAAPVPLLKDALRQTSTKLGFNVELKYPPETLFTLIHGKMSENETIEPSLPGPHSYFMTINKFCDKILDTIWENAGHRYVILSSFNPDICLALHLKQNHLPVLFITRGGIHASKSKQVLDPRHHNINSAVCWAHMMKLDGLVTLGEHFGSVGEENQIHLNILVEDLRKKKLACFVYGEGVSEMKFLEKARKNNITGVIADRLDGFMQEYNSLKRSSTSRSCL